jgi:phosphohistidine swiveling domain-containing protein
MKMANENKFAKDSPAEASSLDSTLKALLYKLENLSSSTDEIELPDEHLEEILFCQSGQLRNLAAKKLDEKGISPSKITIRKLIRIESSEILIKYLEFTRAKHHDLLLLIPEFGKSLPIIKSLQDCEKICSENIIREVIAKLGWECVNYGLSVKHCIGLSISGSLPLFLSDAEARLFEKSFDANRVSEFYLFTAHGGSPIESTEASESEKPVALFRSYNLAHANLLNEILDVAPLTAEKVKGIIEQLDKIVGDFVKLFQSYSDECKIIPDIYEKIKAKVIAELEKETSESHLSADLTRLVQMFEDPHNAAEVHTLHGLKRYLHQKGLQLGFKLVDQSRSPNQNISLVLTTKNKILSVVQNINFADFEPVSDTKILSDDFSYPIKVVIDGFERQMLHGLGKFPSVNIFVYGNEVHYFVWFRNHPVFIRIDYSPPLQGGMIDLQYFGVSNYEIADHPNIYLDAVRYFFQYLEFDVKMNGTHIHARYDKERALDLNQLCERVQYLFCLAPYLMDLDWVIGSLNLPSDAKKKVTTAWAKLFKEWCVLPIDDLLTKDRLGIIEDILETPEGEYELVWPGEGEYQDRFTVKIEKGFFDNIYDYVDKLGRKISKFSDDNPYLPGQKLWEENLLYPLREAFNTGEIVETQEGFKKASGELFEKIHEATWFAGIISQGGKELEYSVALAKVIIPLEQTLKIQSTGTLENFKIQTASLPLLGKSLKLYLLRDNNSIIRLAFYVIGNSLYRKRKKSNDPWQVNAEYSPVKLMALLRANNYNVTGTEANVDSLQEDVQKFLNDIQSSYLQCDEIRTPGAKIVIGLRASPGRATGRVILGSEGRQPEDFNEHIFVAASISPDENTILYHSAGIVATGGGILSHAGLIATQFNKPAIIISGKWIQAVDGTLVLIFQTTEYEVEYKKERSFHISLYHNLHEVDHQLLTGDLVVLDASEGTLEVLGQESDTIALYEDFKSLGKTNEEISRVSDAKELLVLRGKKLHIRHQIEKLLKRISEPVIIKYAIVEILTGKFFEGNKSTPEEKAYLLNLILQNEKHSRLAETFLFKVVNEIENRFLTACLQAQQIIPLAQHPFEVVMPRLEAIRISDVLNNVIASTTSIITDEKKILFDDVDRINEISLLSLNKLRDTLINKIKETTGSLEKKEFLRHLFRQLNRVDLLLATSSEEIENFSHHQKKYELEDNMLCEKLSDKFVLKPQQGALELVPLIGWKAANLAELEMVGGKGLIPNWFVVTDKAFQTVLQSPIKENFSAVGDTFNKETPVNEAINKILLRTDLSNRDKSSIIRNLWETISLPEEIKNEVIEAYKEIEKEFLSNQSDNEKDSKLYVAIRSSSCEEDAEIAARAGEFETYLFINGEDLLIQFLKRTWSGLWTERAIHNRKIFGSTSIGTKGGVIVQRIVWSRISGVLQTINVPKKDLKEIVINAGLGLGEGVVSGAVAADQIIVVKEGNLEKGPLKFNYITADKNEQIVFNKKAGYGTLLSPTLYHQRFRPALEYVELCELVAATSKLESAYGYPIDIEFGIEGTKLWLLQVRPVATFLPAFNETLNKYPLVRNSESQRRN